ATTDDLAHNHPKHDLDLIEPRTVFWRVHEPDAMALLRQELLPALHRLQHPTDSLLARGVLDAAQPRHRLRQGVRAMGVQVVQYKAIPRFRIELDRLLNMG